MKKSEIIEQMSTWIADIRCDLRASWPSQEEKFEMQIQLNQLIMSLALLESVGDNCNILS